MIPQFRRGTGHGHEDVDIAAQHDREVIRQHLVAAHHWPAVARYEASAVELDDLHVAMHDPSRNAETVTRMRVMLDM